jgi:hypothetical protein
VLSEFRACIRIKIKGLSSPTLFQFIIILYLLYYILYLLLHYYYIILYYIILYYIILYLFYNLFPGEGGGGAAGPGLCEGGAGRQHARRHPQPGLPHRDRAAAGPSAPIPYFRGGAPDCSLLVTVAATLFSPYPCKAVGHCIS